VRGEFSFPIKKEKEKEKREKKRGEKKGRKKKFFEY